jgi:hypothetical protein
MPVGIAQLNQRERPKTKSVSERYRDAVLAVSQLDKFPKNSFTSAVYSAAKCELEEATKAAEAAGLKPHPLSAGRTSIRGGDV